MCIFSNISGSKSKDEALFYAHAFDIKVTLPFFFVCLFNIISLLLLFERQRDLREKCSIHSLPEIPATAVLGQAKARS